MGQTANVIFPQTKERAYRDPCAYKKDGICHLYYSLVQNETDGQYFYVAESTSSDMEHWSEPRILTKRGKDLNYSSPGNVFFYDGFYWMCLQTYPRENGEIYGNAASRIFLMKSKDLTDWSEPSLLRVKGDGVTQEEMGRMIDPYIIRNGDQFICFYKQNGVSFSTSDDLKHWTFAGSTACGENVSVIRKNGYYYIFHSPKNGIGLLRTKDLQTFEDCGVTTLGQERYEWARDRITAGFVLEEENGMTLFFHGDREDDYVFGASLAMIENWKMEDWFPLP
jgi:hypothetical protein